MVVNTGLARLVTIPLAPGSSTGAVKASLVFSGASFALTTIAWLPPGSGTHALPRTESTAALPGGVVSLGGLADVLRVPLSPSMVTTEVGVLT